MARPGSVNRREPGIALSDGGGESAVESLVTAPVTIFIPARDAARTLGRCLNAVASSTYREHRVVVIDDRSTDGTAEVARAAGAEVVPSPDPGGLGAARNLALDSCSTRYLAFLNADCYPRPDWLASLLRVLDTTGSAMVGGRQEELRKGTLAERWKSVHLRQDLGPHDIADPDYLSGGNLVMALDRIGDLRFDPRYTIAYEDVDFCRRLRAAGQRLAYHAGATVDHDHIETLRSLPVKVWSYGVSSRAVGAFSGARGALRGFARMHRRPHDQIRTALVADARTLRVDFLAVDLFLLAASLRLFLAHRNSSDQPAYDAPTAT